MVAVSWCKAPETFEGSILSHRRCHRRLFLRTILVDMYFRADTLLIHSFILMSSGISIGCGTGVGVRTLSEYALGHQKFSTSRLTASLLASLASGSCFFLLVEQTYTDGLFVLGAFLLMPVSLCVSGTLAPRMRRFLECFSVAEAVGNIYGAHVQVLSAIGHVFVQTTRIAMQFSVIARVLEYALSAPHARVALTAIILTVVYSSFQGARTTTTTGLIQLIAFGVILPAVALEMWYATGSKHDVKGLWSFHPNFDFKAVFSGKHASWQAANLMTLCVLPLFCSPEVFQRMAMARDVQQAKRVLCYTSLLLMGLFMLMAWMGILMLADHPNLLPEEIVMYLVKHHLSTGLQGLLCVGVLALAMSTSETLLNTCSVLCANDIVKPAYRQRLGSAAAARAFSCLLGGLALIISLEQKSLLEAVITIGRYYLPVFPMPFVLAVMGFRTTTRVVLAGMLAGFISMMLWSHVYDPSTSLIPGLLTHLTVLFGAHYLLGEPGGWVGVRQVLPPPRRKRFSASDIHPSELK